MGVYTDGGRFKMDNFYVEKGDGPVPRWERIVESLKTKNFCFGLFFCCDRGIPVTTSRVYHGPSFLFRNVRTPGEVNYVSDFKFLRVRRILTSLRTPDFPLQSSMEDVGTHRTKVQATGRTEWVVARISWSKGPTVCLLRRVVGSTFYKVIDTTGTFYFHLPSRVLSPTPSFLLPPPLSDFGFSFFSSFYFYTSPSAPSSPH